MRLLAVLSLMSASVLSAQSNEMFFQLRLNQARQGTDQYVDGSGQGASMGVQLSQRRFASACLQMDARLEVDRFRNDAERIELNGVGLGFGAHLYFGPKPEGVYVLAALTAQHWGYTRRSSGTLQSFNATRAGQKIAVGWRQDIAHVEIGIQETVVDADLRWSHSYVGFGLQF